MTKRDVTARAQGQAALMMLDNLPIALVEAGVIQVDRVIEAIEITITAKRGMLESGEEPEVVHAAIGTLSELATSLAATRRRGSSA